MVDMSTKMRKTILVRCIVRGCKNTNHNSSRSFFNFPKCKRRDKLWLKACRLVGLSIREYSKKVCSEHFEMRYMNRFSNRLLPDAVPTIFLPFKSTSPCDSTSTETMTTNNSNDFWLVDESATPHYIVSTIDLPPLVPIRRGADFSSPGDSTLPDDHTVPPLVPIERRFAQNCLSSELVLDVPPLVAIQPARIKSETTGIKLVDDPLMIKTEEVEFELKVEESESSIDSGYTACQRVEVKEETEELAAHFMGSSSERSFATHRKVDVKEETRDLDEKGDFRFFKDSEFFHGELEEEKTGELDEHGDMQLFMDSEIKENFFDIPDYVWIKREPSGGFAG